MASSYKFNPILLEMVTPIIDKHDDVLWYLFGPDSWNSTLQNKFNNEKVKIFPANAGDEGSYLYHIAADIHIDSFPFTSLTSALETIREEGVVLSFCPWPSVNDLILCIEPSDYAAEASILTCPSVNSYAEKLDELLTSRETLAGLQKYGSIAMRKHDKTEWTLGMDEVRLRLGIKCTCTAHRMKCF